MTEDDFVSCWGEACVHRRCIKSDTTVIGTAMWGCLHVTVGNLSMTMGSTEPTKDPADRSYWMQVGGDRIGGENTRMDPEKAARCVLMWNSSYGHLKTRDQILDYLKHE